MDACKPGDRVAIVGVYKAVPPKASGPVTAQFRAVVVANNVKRMVRDAGASMCPACDTRALTSFVTRSHLSSWMHRHRGQPCRRINLPLPHNPLPVPASQCPTCPGVRKLKRSNGIEQTSAHVQRLRRSRCRTSGTWRRWRLSPTCWTSWRVPWRPPSTATTSSRRPSCCCCSAAGARTCAKHNASKTIEIIVPATCTAPKPSKTSGRL